MRLLHLLLQKRLEVFAEPLFKMITPCLLPPLALKLKDNTTVNATYSDTVRYINTCKWMGIERCKKQTRFVALVELRQPFDELREARVRVVLEVVFLERLELAGQTALARGTVQHTPLAGILRAD